MTEQREAPESGRTSGGETDGPRGEPDDPRAERGDRDAGAEVRVDLLQGTLDLLILKTLTGEAMHGYGIARWLEDATGDALRVEEGSLYPALHRMARKGWIRSEWGRSENNRRAKFYSLTPAGRARLREETREWRAFAEVVGRVLSASPA